MSSIGLDLLGGIGKGVMIGADQIRRQEAHDAGLTAQQEQQRLQRQQADELSQHRQQQSQRLNESHEWTRNDRARQEQERQRQQDYQALYGEVASELGDDATPEAVSAGVLRRGLQAGVIPQAEVRPLLEQAQRLRQAGVIGAIRRGDTAELSRILSGPQQFGRPVRMELGEGPDEFGQASHRYRIVDEADGRQLADFSPAQIGALFGADDLLEEAEQRAKAAKTRSEIGENQAQANAANALAQQRRTNPTGAATDPTRGFSATAREEARRVELERKAAAGTASPEELDLLGVLQHQAQQRATGYVPPEAKKSKFWRDAPADQVEAEVDRQLAAIRLQAKADPYLTQQLQDPTTLDALRRDIRMRMGAQLRSSGAEMVHGQQPGAAPQAASQGMPIAAPGQRTPDLNQYLK